MNVRVYRHYTISRITLYDILCYVMQMYIFLSCRHLVDMGVCYPCRHRKRNDHNDHSLVYYSVPFSATMLSKFVKSIPSYLSRNFSIEAFLIFRLPSFNAGSKPLFTKLYTRCTLHPSTYAASFTVYKSFSSLLYVLLFSRTAKSTPLLSFKMFHLFKHNSRLMFLNSKLTNSVVLVNRRISCCIYWHLPNIIISTV